MILLFLLLVFFLFVVVPVGVVVLARVLLLTSCQCLPSFPQVPRPAMKSMRTAMAMLKRKAEVRKRPAAAMKKVGRRPSFVKERQ